MKNKKKAVFFKNEKQKAKDKDLALMRL